MAPRATGRRWSASRWKSPTCKPATDGSRLVVSGSLDGTANSHFRIEFFANASQDASGHGEGQTYLGYAEIAANRAADARYR